MRVLIDDATSFRRDEGRACNLVESPAQTLLVSIERAERQARETRHTREEKRPKFDPTKAGGRREREEIKLQRGTKKSVCCVGGGWRWGREWE